MTTVPFMSTDESESRIASTARRSDSSLLPRPCSGAAASAPGSVTRRSSSARLRLIFGSSSRAIEREVNSGAPSDRQFVGLDPQLLLARQTALAASVDIHARSLEDGGDADLVVAE